MPKYVITAPDGVKYNVEGEGTEEEALAGFQAQWEPSAPAEASYSNEGRRTPQPALKKSLGTRTLEGAQDFGTSFHAGADTFGRSLDKWLRGGLNKVGVPNMTPETAEPADLDLNVAAAAAKARSPVASTVGKFAGQEAIPTLVGGGAGNLIGKGVLAGRALRDVSLLRRGVATLAENVGAGAVGGALGPQEGSRAVGALEGGVIGGGAGLVGSALLRGAQKGYRAVKDFSPIDDAGKYLSSLVNKGGSTTEAVLAKLRGVSASLPGSSVAAQAENNSLAAAEQYSRKYASERTRPGWNSIDETTSREGGEALGDAVANDLANLMPNVDAKKAALADTETMLGKIRMTTDSKKDFSAAMDNLANTDAKIIADPKAQAAIGVIKTIVEGDNAKTADVLSSLWTNVGDMGLSAPSERAIKQVLREHADAIGGGTWTQALDEYATAAKALETNKAASDIYGTFKSQFAGDKKDVSSAALGKALSKFGEVSEDGITILDKLDPNTRAAIQDVIERVGKSEAPTATNAGRLDRPNPWQVPERQSMPETTTVAGAIKNAIESAKRDTFGDRPDMVRDATDLALQNKQAFIEALDAAVKSGRIQEKDAALVRRMMTGVAAATGSSAVSGAHPYRSQ